MTTRKYSSRSQQTTLTSAVTSGASIIPVVSATTLLGGATISTGQTFTAVIDPDTALEEIVEITVVSSNNLTVNRAVDMSGAAAQDHSSGAVIRHMIIGRDLREANLHIEATGAYNDGTGTHAMHGLGSSDGVVVGTDAEQTLTRKTLTSPIITGGAVDASITFEGSTADAYETTLTVVDPTADRTITLPNTSGTVVLKDSVDTLTNKTLTSPTISGSPVITGLSSAGMSASSAAPKSYVDAILVLQEASAASSAVSAASSAASATAAATSATSAAASATAAATSATSAAASATTASASVASIATYASNALASQTAAATSATSAAASATAAATSATSAAASATTASNSASTATTQAAAAVTSANSAATSATSAAASATTAAASVASIATYASNALASQTAAATSATSAAVSATAAATSASSAATSASSAATSASSAATTYDNFDDRYLGSKASAPTVDNDGNPLLVGAIYWNSTLNNMYVWSGSVWVQIATTSVYTAPTLGSTAINSATTYANVDGLTINSTTIPSSKTLVATDSTQYVVPSQTGNSGKFLTTDGTTSSWGTVDLSTKQDVVAGVSSTEIGYLDGVTSAIQTQIDSKAPLASPTFTGTVTLPSGTVTSTMIADGTIVNADINAAAAIDWTKIAPSSTVSATELGYLDGVTSAIQTQLNTKVSTAGGSTITASGASVIPLVLQGAASQTGDLLQIKNSAGTALVIVQADGTFRAKDPLITRSDSTSEGGQLNLARAVDNTAAYAIDVVGNTTATTFRVVNLTAGTAPLAIDSTGATTVSYTTTTGGAVRNIYMSTADPSGGTDGDVWIKYTA